MFHIELRKSPHTLCIFNQSEQQLLALVRPWARDEWIEVGERNWNMRETKMTILEGPQLSMGELAMNRGWRNAQRNSQDVTEQILTWATEDARASAIDVAAAPAPPANGEAADSAIATAAASSADDAELQLLADSLALEILSMLDAAPAALSRVWQLAQERLPERPAADSLALAERAIRSLLARRLIALQSNGAPVADQLADQALRAVASWSAGAPDALLIARSA